MIPKGRDRFADQITLETTIDIAFRFIAIGT